MVSVCGMVMADSIDDIRWNIVLERSIGIILVGEIFGRKWRGRDTRRRKRNIFQNDFLLDKAVNNSCAIVSRWFHVAHRKHTVFVQRERTIIL